MSGFSRKIVSRHELPSEWYEVRRALFEERYVPEPNTGCFIWIGHISRDGYGVFSSKGVRATHMALALAGKTLPRGMLACHHCDNPCCVNPDHLFAGTDKDNAIDSARKRRRAKSHPSCQGEKQRNAKLTERDVRLIRQSGAVGRQHLVLAEQYGVSRRTIFGICNGTVWKHVQ